MYVQGLNTVHCTEHLLLKYIIVNCLAQILLSKLLSPNCLASPNLVYLSKVFNTSKYLILTSKFTMFHILARNFVFAPNHLLYAVVLYSV